MPCIAIVNPDQLAALEELGKFKRVLEPGLHFILPWANVRYVSTRVRETRTQIETKTKDNVFVQLDVAVQHEVTKEHAEKAIYKASDPQVQIESFVSHVVRSHVPRMDLDRLFEAKKEIASELKEHLTEAAENFGFVVHQVLIVDIRPDAAVKRAMNQINANQRLRIAAQEKAEAEKVTVVKAAEAEADSKFLQGQGLARSRAAIINGLKDAIAGPDGGDSLTAKDMTELLLMTQYLDTLDKVAQGPATTIFVPHSGAGDIQARVRDGMAQASALR